MGISQVTVEVNNPDDLELSLEEIARDYRLAFQSRQVSIIARKEVLTGKAKFGIFGDGKEIAQIAMAKAFKAGDFRSGYYRDQTLAFATGMMTIKQFFAQLYGHADVTKDPHSAGRQMNNHIATRMIDATGEWKELTSQAQSSADLAPTGSQMPRLVGLAYASVLFKKNKALQVYKHLSKEGQEVAFGTIGNASCAEGVFWEAINAMGVLQVPVILSIWDDEYGISVPNKFQIAKSDLSAVLSGFKQQGDIPGYYMQKVKGWDYQALCEAYKNAEEWARNKHVPCIIHVTELTQPLGHSTSGSHERYKPQDRLAWEKEHDSLYKMREWMLEKHLFTQTEIDEWEKEELDTVKKYKQDAWDEYQADIRQGRDRLIAFAKDLALTGKGKDMIQQGIIQPLIRSKELFHKDYMEAAYQLLIATRDDPAGDTLRKFKEWRKEQEKLLEKTYDANFIGDLPKSPLDVPAVAPIYSENSKQANGYEILNKCFDLILQRNPRVVAFGEDVGKLGDVNQAFAGLQAMHGELRVTDTGIREATIIGQAIGLAMRGLRPIAEIQYLDYLLYAIQILSDDVATLAYRTSGGQRAPLIIRTRGHRLEGIWHSGSPMGMIINSLRGMHVAVPRNMTQAVGFYHTLLDGEEPGLIVEVLNAYRLKETLPDNLGEIRVPLGVPEILSEGKDISIVTYGACCRIGLQAAEILSQLGISVELIDVQTLLPFDLHHTICQSLHKTNRVLFLDEDVPGGATAYMMQQVLEVQGGYQYLDSAPATLTAKAHRPAYGSDGDYWSKPQVEHVVQTVLEIMNEFDPVKYPLLD